MDNVVEFITMLVLIRITMITSKFFLLFKYIMEYDISFREPMEIHIVALILIKSDVTQ